MQKKIMFVDERKVVGYSGGAEKIICAFADEFVRRGFAVSLVCMDEKIGLPFFPLSDDVRFVNLCYDYGKPFGGAKWLAKKIQREIMRGIGGRDFIIAGKKYPDPKKQYFFGEFAARLQKCVADIRPDVIIAVSEDSAYLAENASDVPVIAMCHGNPLDFVDSFSPAQKKAWRDARFVQVLQPRFARELNGRGYDNVITIPNFVGQFADAEIADAKNCRKKIMTAGRLEGGAKRQHLLVEAFSLVAEKFPDWTLDIYGAADNPRYKKKLVRMARKKNLAERIRFMGVTQDFAAALRECDIFAFPSASEGFGLAVAEAMSMGLPVLACRECYPTDEFIADGETGLLADGGAEAFAEKLALLMNDSRLRARLGKAAHEAMKSYAPKNIWDAWESVLENIFDGG